MLKVHIWSHKDGDHLAVVEVPWWHDILDWLFTKLFCPCCGFSGWLSGKAEWLEIFFWKLSNHLSNFTWKLEKELYKTPIESGCVATRTIFDPKSSCWRDNCDVCWAEREDAYSHEARREE